MKKPEHNPLVRLAEGNTASQRLSINESTGEVWIAGSGIVIGIRLKQGDAFRFTAYREPYRQLTGIDFDSVDAFLQDLEAGAQS